MSTPFSWLSATPSSTDTAIYAYLEAARLNLKASLTRATLAYNALKKTREKLGLPFMATPGGEGATDTLAAWAPDLETQAQDLHAAATFLDQAALDAKAGKRDLVWNKAFSNFAISELPSDVIHVTVSQGNEPVVLDAKTKQPVHVNAPLGVSGINWLEAAVVGAVPTVGLYLITKKFLDSMEVIAEQKTQRTLAEAAKKHADLVLQGKATPEQAKKLDDALYTGANELQNTINKPKLDAENTSRKWADAAATIAWAGVVIAGILVASKLIPSRALLENPPRVHHGYALSTGRTAGLRGQDWQHAKDDDWEHVVVGGGRYEYVGSRIIDGTKMNVWYERLKQRYVAQTAVG